MVILVKTTNYISSIFFGISFTGSYVFIHPLYLLLFKYFWIWDEGKKRCAYAIWIFVFPYSDVASSIQYDSLISPIIVWYLGFFLTIAMLTLGCLNLLEYYQFTVHTWWYLSNRVVVVIQCSVILLILVLYTVRLQACKLCHLVWSVWKLVLHIN